MDNEIFISRAVDMVVEYYFYAVQTGLKLIENMPKDADIHRSSVYVVWSCKTLQNNKALLSTPFDDTRYFEVTYNGDKKEFYLDCYVKENNIVKGI